MIKAAYMSGVIGGSNVLKAGHTMHFSKRRSLLDSVIVMACLLVIPTLGCRENVPPTAPASAVAPPGSPEPSTETPTTAREPGEAPPEATIKALLEKGMWGPPEQGGTIHTYNYQSLKVAAPRKGDYLTDGIPANTDTTVYGVKVVVEVVRTFSDGTSRNEVKNQSYVFFKDEFDDWTYRFIQNN